MDSWVMKPAGNVRLRVKSMEDCSLGGEECQQPNLRSPVSGFDNRALAPSSKASLDASNWKLLIVSKDQPKKGKGSEYLSQPTFSNQHRGKCFMVASRPLFCFAKKPSLLDTYFRIKLEVIEAFLQKQHGFSYWNH